MAHISADGGKGGDSYGEGQGGQGGKGGQVHMINLGIMNLENIINSSTSSTIIIQRFNEIMDQVEKDGNLSKEQKSKTRERLETLRDVFVKAEEYARPFIVQALSLLAQDNIHI